MGRIERAIEKQKKERHIDTKEVIAVMQWYIQEMNKLHRDFADTYHDYLVDGNNLTEALNTRLEELKAEAK